MGDNIPSTSSYQWRNGSFYHEIENATQEKLWFKIYGRNATSVKEEKKVLKRIRVEINLVRNAIVGKIQKREMRKSPLCVYISEFLNELTHSLCKFEERFFPMEWILPKNCCIPHEFSKSAPEGKYTMIVSIRMQPLSDVLQDPDSSEIAKHISEMPGRSQKSAYDRASRFFREFVNDAVEHLYGYKIKWVIENDPPEPKQIIEKRRQLQYELYVGFLSKDETGEKRMRIDDSEIKTKADENKKRLRKVDEVAEFIPIEPQNSFERVSADSDSSSINETQGEISGESEHSQFKLPSYFEENPDKINEISLILAKIERNREKLNDSVGSISGPSRVYNQEGNIHRTSFNSSLINQESTRDSQVGAVLNKSRPRDSLDVHRSRENIGRLIKETDVILNTHEPSSHDSILSIGSNMIVDSCLTSSTCSRSERIADEDNGRHGMYISCVKPTMRNISDVLTIKTDAEEQRIRNARYTPPSSSPRLNIANEDSTNASPVSKTMLSTPISWSPGYLDDKSIDSRIKDTIRDLELMDNEMSLDISPTSYQEKGEEMDGCPLLESDESDEENGDFIGYSEARASQIPTQGQNFDASHNRIKEKKSDVHANYVTVSTEESEEVIVERLSCPSEENNYSEVKEVNRPEVSKPENINNSESSLVGNPTQILPKFQQEPQWNHCDVAPKKEEKSSKSTSTSTFQHNTNIASPFQNKSSTPSVNIKFAKKKLSPLVAKGFGFNYEDVTLETLHLLPKHIQLMSRMKTSDNRWFNQIIDKYEIFGEYGTQCKNEETKKLMKNVCSQLSSNQPTITNVTSSQFSSFFTSNKDEPVDHHQLKKFVKNNMKNRFRLDSGQFKYYIPNNWIDHLYQLVSGKSSSFNFINSLGDDNCALWYIARHLPAHAEREMKQRNFELCMKLVFDLVRTVLILKIDDNGDHHLFFDGSLDIKTPSTYANSTSSSPLESE